MKVETVDIRAVPTRHLRAILDVPDDTLRSWLAEGMPCTRGAPGRTHTFDLEAVFWWTVGREAMKSRGIPRQPAVVVAILGVWSSQGRLFDTYSEFMTCARGVGKAFGVDRKEVDRLLIAVARLANGCETA